MKFDVLLAKLQDRYPDTIVYSVENRNMLNHETAIEYFLNEYEAIALAETLWNQVADDEKDCYEISVHLGEMEPVMHTEKLHFVVHKKLFKAYKKIHVTEEFFQRFIQKYSTDCQRQSGVGESEAIRQAKTEFQAKYLVQKPVAYGMFAGYNYAPALED